MIASASVDLETLVGLELPALPAAAMRVAELTQNPNASARQIAEAIGCDPVLGARVLRAANSALYCLQRSVTALPTAVNAIGNENIYMLVIASAAAGAFHRNRAPTQIETVLWRHSIAVGLTARQIMLKMNLRGMEEGFLCGLLHDIGKLLLLRYDPAGYQLLLEELAEEDLMAAELERYGYSHSQIGGVAAKRWDLPEEICHAICFHHQPGQAETSMLMARVVDIADMLANRSGLGIGFRREYEPALSESVVALRLSETQLEDIWTRTESGMNEVFTLFNN
jgi:HD-like signal output (HDOD) protein